MSGRVVSRWVVDCGPGGLDGRTIGVDGLEQGSNDVLVRWSPRGEETQTVVLNRESRKFEPGGVDEAPANAWSVAKTYLIIGVEHILLGFDHLLFVFGLLLLVRERRTLVATITAFTIAHSITLALSSLGVLTLSQAAVEAVIAASLMLLAVEVVRLQKGDVGWTARAPWSVAFAFGLLHGFGFAGALAEIGLPEGELPVALAAFNVGVELGQLGVVAVWVLAAEAVRRVEWERPDWLPRAAAYVVGLPAAYWMIERISGIVT
jgi:hydrogenase/urease accessory protein HupE